MSREKLLATVAFLLALVELAFAASIIWQFNVYRERFPQPVTEAPPGYSWLADERPLLALFALMVAAAAALYSAWRAHPWTERDPHRRMSPWGSMILALAGLLMVPLLWLRHPDLVLVVVQILFWITLCALAIFAMRSRRSPMFSWQCGQCEKWNAGVDATCLGCSAPRPRSETRNCR